MPKILFSIIIPTFNRAERLFIALKSIESQTFKDFEVIVCDDGSNDNSKEIADSFRERMHITYLWSENWGGPAKPRNIGIRQSRGEWICFLDSDDYWFPNKLEMCLSYIGNRDFIYHNFTVEGNKTADMTQQFVGRQISNKDAYIDLLLHWNCIANSSVVVRKSVLDKAGFFDENKDLIGIEDFDMWLRVAKQTNRFTFIPKQLGVYYLSSKSLTRDVEKCIHNDMVLLDKCKNDLSSCQYERTMGLLNLNNGLMYLKTKNKRKANSYFFKALYRKSTMFVKIKAMICLIFGNYAFRLSQLYNAILNQKHTSLKRKANQ